MHLIDKLRSDVKIIYGIYTYKGGKKYIEIHFNNGKRKHILYSRWLMEQHIGRFLEDYERVDHIDGNHLNNKIVNLRIITWFKCECGKHREAVQKACFDCLAKDGEEQSAIGIVVSAFRFLGSGKYSTSELAEVTGFSKRHLLRVFKVLIQKKTERSFYLERFPGEMGSGPTVEKQTHWRFVSL